MSHTIHHVAFTANNLFQQKHPKVIKPTKRLKTSIKSTIKPVSLLTYYTTISATFNTMINQKHHAILHSITTEKMSKIPIQCHLPIISTGTVMNLKTTENSLS